MTKFYEERLVRILPTGTLGLVENGDETGAMVIDTDDDAQWWDASDLCIEPDWVLGHVYSNDPLSERQIANEAHRGVEVTECVCGNSPSGNGLFYCMPDGRLPNIPENGDIEDIKSIWPNLVLDEPEREPIEYWLEHIVCPSCHVIYTQRASRRLRLADQTTWRNNAPRYAYGVLCAVTGAADASLFITADSQAV